MLILPRYQYDIYSQSWQMMKMLISKPDQFTDIHAGKFAWYSMIMIFSNLPLNTYRSPARNSKKWVTLLKNENFHKYMLTKNNALFCLCTILCLLWTFCFRSGGWVRSCSGFPPRQRQASLQVSRTYLTFFHMYTIICNLSLKSYKFSKFS